MRRKRKTKPLGTYRDVPSKRKKVYRQKRVPTVASRDRKRLALPPGVRISKKSGRRYTEYRSNRSDRRKKTRI